MFWNKKDNRGTAPAASESTPPKAEKKPKEKKLSKKDIVIGQIEMLEPGNSLSFLTKTWSGNDLMVVSINPAYPGKGHKYSVSYEELSEGKPSGKRQHIGDSDKAKQVADWILSRNGEPYTPEST